VEDQTGGQTSELIESESYSMKSQSSSASESAISVLITQYQADEHRSILSYFAWATLAIILLALPFVMAGFVVFQFTLVLIYGVAIMGLVILTGYSGQFSLGHVAFFAIGAYTVAILVDRGLASYPLALFIGGAVSFFFGFLFGLPALRLEGIYLTLATFALSVATPQVLKLTPLIPFTGGVNGISLNKPSVPFELPINSDQWLYFVTLIFALAMLWVAIKLMRTRSGRALLALRDNSIAARAMGVNVAVYKSLAFGISGLYAGVAGGLSALVVQYVSPDSFTMHLSIAFFVGMVIGGYRWLPGSFFGALYLVFMPHISESFGKGSEGIAAAVCLIATVFLMPSGLHGFISWVVSKFKVKLISKDSKS
jgi:branched-chain amino acid transport system permease protein